MSKFKVGDRVKVIAGTNSCVSFARWFIGVVAGFSVPHIMVELDREACNGKRWYFRENELDFHNAVADSECKISPHYTTDSSGKDFLQRFFETKSPEAVHGAMTFLMGKYIDRLGKKDAPEKELAKIIDYATRYRDFLNK